MRFELSLPLAERERTLPIGMENEASLAAMNLSTGNAAAGVLDVEDFDPDELYLDLGVGD